MPAPPPHQARGPNRARPASTAPDPSCPVRPRLSGVVPVLFGEPCSLDQVDLIERLGRGRIAGPCEPQALVHAMVDRGLIAPVEGGMTIMPIGPAVFLPLRTAVERITAKLVEDVPKANLETTRRTLDSVMRRADHLPAARRQSIHPWTVRTCRIETKWIPGTIRDGVSAAPSGSRPSSICSRRSHATARAAAAWASSWPSRRRPT